MNNTLSLLSFLGIIFLICSCDNDVITEAEKVSFVGEWKLVAFDTLGKEMDYVDPQDKIVISFHEDSLISGTSMGLCVNSFGGKYEITDMNVMNISNFISTRAACPQSSYWQFVRGLAEVDRYELNDRLYLYNDKKHTKIILKREKTKD